MLRGKGGCGGIEGYVENEEKRGWSVRVTVQRGLRRRPHGRARVKLTSDVTP